MSFLLEKAAQIEEVDARLIQLAREAIAESRVLIAQAEKLLANSEAITRDFVDHPVRSSTQRRFGSPIAAPHIARDCVG